MCAAAGSPSVAKSQQADDEQALEKASKQVETGQHEGFAESRQPYGGGSRDERRPFLTVRSRFITVTK